MRLFSAFSWTGVFVCSEERMSKICEYVIKLRKDDEIIKGVASKISPNLAKKALIASSIKPKSSFETALLDQIITIDIFDS